MVGNAIKIDLLTDKGARGPTECFGCGTFEHLKGGCPQSKIVKNKEKGSGEAEDPVRLDQYEKTGSIQERIENERDNFPVELLGEGQENLSESSTKIMNGRKFDGGKKGENTKAKGHKKWVVAVKVQVNKQAMGGPRMENQDGGIEETGMSSETLKIGMKWGMVDCLEVEGRAADIREENIELMVLDQAVSGKILGQPSGVVHGGKNDATLIDDSFDE
ncbi:hypothetical protein Gogos_004728 [Gossypium gossypioides]|uniref:Uncharacterized protein n=1 Tax=Gossypium gossypioides TaxID=34282 RepID=A0A7J9CH53_GOSGO|nr:hypothetical protein [Gossypium gossypioides]